MTCVELGVDHEDSARLRLMDRTGYERFRLTRSLATKDPAFPSKIRTTDDSLLSVSGMTVERFSIFEVQAEKSSTSEGSSAVQSPSYSTEQSPRGNASPGSKMKSAPRPTGATLEARIQVPDD
jgi:hypothetical protein